MRNPLHLSILVLALTACHGFAQDPLTARPGALSLESPYVPVPLHTGANHPRAVSFPSDRVQWQNVPFDLVKKPGATHLFLKPIGWSAWKNEEAEYRSYIAHYDNRAANTNNPMRAIV